MVAKKASSFFDTLHFFVQKTVVSNMNEALIWEKSSEPKVCCCFVFFVCFCVKRGVKKRE